MKQCAVCKESKSLTEYHRDKNKKDGLAPRCKACCKQAHQKWHQENKESRKQYDRKRYPKRKESILASNKVWRTNNKNKWTLSVKNANYKRKYGITLEEYNGRKKRQCNACAICGKEETARWRGTLRSLSIDHDHKTGRIRGLLCTKCNIALGNVNDDIGILAKMMEYLKMET